MAKLKVVLDRAGVRQLLRCAGMEEVCRSHAAQALGRCGPGYEMDTYTGKNRVSAMVWAWAPAARADNARNNTILKALK